MSAPRSVADSLGLTHSELLFVTQRQQILAQQGHQGSMADRGRGPSRQSQPSSRAASAASSQSVPGRLLLDPHSLQSLYSHLESLMRHIQNQIETLELRTEQSVSHSSGRAGSAMQDADSEIKKMRRIIADIDALEERLAMIKTIRDKIRRFKNNVDAVSDRLDRSRPSGHSSSARPRR